MLGGRIPEILELAAAAAIPMADYAGRAAPAQALLRLLKFGGQIFVVVVVLCHAGGTRGAIAFPTGAQGKEPPTGAQTTERVRR